jgi:signal transduction histidine kinase
VGLAVVKKAVELYGGKVWIESTVGEGSSFYFTLPKPAAAGKAEG